MSEPTRPYANSLTFTTFFEAIFFDEAGSFFFIKLNIMFRLELEATLLAGATKLATTACAVKWVQWSVNKILLEKGRVVMNCNH